MCFAYGTNGYVKKYIPDIVDAALYNKSFILAANTIISMMT